MKGIILEGISASGKSTLLRLIQQKILDAHPALTKLFISEHYTQRMLEHEIDAQSLTSEHVKKHTDEIIRHLNSYQTMLNQSKFAQRPAGADAFVTIERFLLTFLATHRDRLSDYSFVEAERQLSQLHALNIRQYLLVLSPETLSQHIARTLTHRNAQWADYVKRKGGVGSIVKESMEWQDNFLDLASRFERSMKTEIVPISSWDYEEVAEAIYDKGFKN